MKIYNTFEAIYLQPPEDEQYSNRTWSEDRINSEDEKFINIGVIKDRFKSIINGKGPVIPRIAIKCAIEELENL